MKKIFCFMLLALAVPLMVPADGVAEDSTREAVATAARKGLPAILQQIPAQEVKNYGFESAPELSQAYTGAPLEIYTVEPNGLQAYSGAGFGALLRPTGLWYVPVLVGKESRALLTVAMEEGKWEVVGISAAGLARELQAFEQKLPLQLNAMGVREKDSPRFVRIFQAYSDFMYVPTEVEEYLVPLSSAQAALELAPDKLLTPGEALPLLKLDLGNTGG